MKHKIWHAKRKTVVFFLLLIGFLMVQYVGVSAAPARDVIPPPMATGYVLSSIEQKAVLLLNEDRKNAGLEPLQVNLKLSKLAADYAKDMNTRKFFAHIDPDGKDPFDRMAAIGIDFPNAGENIALSPDVETAHKMLMDSPLHRENILNPKFTEIGIGVRSDSRGGVYLVQEFIGQ
ncbi:MAG TPA: CAP domain-containing protein [Negativicutes bacterium]|nr:CAP domain-containing protein [Negativicutes bacterium]